MLSTRTKTFNLKLLPEVELIETSENGKRFYKTPSGEKYPSVTTVLGSVMDKTKLFEWQARVGKETANKIKTRAANRGTKLHKVCEKYVLNEENFLDNNSPLTADLFKQVKPFIDKNVGDVYGIELPLYSDFLRTAGRCDMFCNLSGKNAIVDYKTSTKPKKEEWIKSYFLQLTTYGMMIEERYNINVPYIVVVIAVEDGEPQIFPKKSDEFRDEVTTIFRNFSKELL